MKFACHQLITPALIGAGVAGMAMTAKPLAEHEALDFPVNLLGVNRSPYGEIFAMAMQGPIDTFWHQGELAKLAPSTAQRGACAICNETDGKCSHLSTASGATGRDSGPLPWNDRLRLLLEELDQASTARTNSHQPSRALDFHIRRQVENKLRFAYRLDPAHYGNYNAYHFFLTEPQVGTRPVLTPAAARLAQETIDYCLAEELDPRPALTAAAAATNVIHLMFADRHNPEPVFSPAQMRSYLELLDYCIARHLAIRKNWIASGHDELLSPMRLLEMEERFTFVRLIRDAAEVAIIRFEESSSPQPRPNEN